MELGALICTPTAPKCKGCPLRSKCEARRLGLQESIPHRPASSMLIEVREVAIVVRRKRRVLLVQRPAMASRWAQMWEFPHGELNSGETHEQAALRLLLDLTGLTGHLGSELLTIRHGVTRFSITMVCLEAKCESGKFRSDFYKQGKWIEPQELASFPVSSPQRRLAKELNTPGRQQQLF
jgi:A/G-specific adenine glycosylase